jgi:DNA-binding response OmpR family regulator
MADTEEMAISPVQWAAGRDVLIVEDERPLRMIIARTLARQGHRAEAAGTVADAIAAMAARLPDVLLLDINLPDGTGWEVLRWLRGGKYRVPAIICSAVPPSPKRVAEFHPDAVLLKPFPMECLLDLVATVGEEPALTGGPECMA